MKEKIVEIDFMKIVGDDPQFWKGSFSLLLRADGGGI